MAARALELDETSAEARVVLAGNGSGAEGDAAGDEAEYRRAPALNPNHVSGHVRCSCELYDGVWLDEAVREARRGQEFAPCRFTPPSARWAGHTDTRGRQI